METINVFTLVTYIKRYLENDAHLNKVLVSGEISNFKNHNSGHLYFTLKDERAAINCVMFSSKARLINFDPKNGDKVIVSGNISVFESTGQMQLYVNNMKIDGLGDLYQRYEELKNKLYAEGYFNQEHKNILKNKYPEKVAVLVGDNSAAMSDIKTTFYRRWPICKVDYYPVLVQGKDAPKNIIENLLLVDELDYDAIILARGGGSFEDLFQFNDESLIKTIYSLKTFLISGVGHEQDYTLVDFVSDLRAPTPTASVELLTPNINDILLKLDDYNSTMEYVINNRIAFLENKYDHLSKNKYLLNPKLIIEKMELKIDSLFKSLNKYSLILKNKELMIDNFVDLIKNNLKSLFLNKEHKIMSLEKLLSAYSYKNTLKRGYSVIYKDNKIIKNCDDLKNNDNIDIQLYNGRLKAEIKEVKNG